MTIAREEIFGPVMSVIAYDIVRRRSPSPTTPPFGLAAYVTGAAREVARLVAKRVRAGYVLINDAEFD